MTKVLEIGLWPYVGLGGQKIVSEKIRKSSATKALFTSQALLYDTLVIPTMDFGIIAAFADWLSIPVFRQALDGESIKFMRYPAMIGYLGNGAGVTANLKFGKGTSTVWDWTHVAAFGSVEEAIQAQTKYGCDNVPDWERSSLNSAILNSAVEFDAPDEFSHRIAEATYKDIANDVGLKNEVGRLHGYGTVELNRLPGPKPNEIRFFSGLQISRDGTEIATPYAPPRDAIDITLAVAQLNIQIAMAGSLGQCDLSTFDVAAVLLEGKLRRAGKRWKNQAFFTAFQIPGVPDVHKAVAEGRLDPASLWAARETPNAREFRRWLASADATDGRELARLYVDLLRQQGPLESLPAKALRWAILTTAAAVASRQAGVLGEITAAAAAGVDSLFLDKWLSGWSPALFVDELRSIRIEPPPLA